MRGENHIVNDINTHRLVEVLEKYITEQGLSGNQFSAAIDRDPSLWSKIKNGERDPSPDFLTAVGRAFPALRNVVQDALFGHEIVEEPEGVKS
jgi:transcriptional regulator with XRE-family HTH domain